MEVLTEYILTFGYIALLATIYAESGLFFAFFLPGDSLLFTAGIFAARGDLNIVAICIGCFVAAILGNQTGYWFGAKVGKSLYNKPDSFLFRKEHIKKTQAFFDQYGSTAIVIARFAPVIRTFAPILAGVVAMDYKRFTLFNILGSVLWAILIPLLGYWLGNVIPDIDRYLLPILAVLIIGSLLPAIWHLWPKKKSGHDQV